MRGLCKGEAGHASAENGLVVGGGGGGHGAAAPLRCLPPHLLLGARLRGGPPSNLVLADVLAELAEQQQRHRLGQRREANEAKRSVQGDGRGDPPPGVSQSATHHDNANAHPLSRKGLQGAPPTGHHGGTPGETLDPGGGGRAATCNGLFAGRFVSRKTWEGGARHPKSTVQRPGQCDTLRNVRHQRGSAPWWRKPWEHR
jgi:hypothetical protein